MIFIVERGKGMKQSGIYKITINDKVYVGMAKSLVARKGCHKNLLDRNKHYNVYLQSDYNIYQEYNFEVIEECDEWVGKKEEMWIDKLQARNRKFGYNISKGGNGGAPWSAAQKINKSNSMVADLNYNYHHKANADDIGFDKYENKMSEKQLMEKYECSRTTIIRRIRKWHKDNGTTYKKQQNFFPQMRNDLDSDELIEDRKNGMTYAQMQKKYNCGSWTIRKRLLG